MAEDQEIPGYYPGQMGSKPGAPPEGSPAQKQIAEAVENASPAPLSKTGVFGPEVDAKPMPKRKKLPQSTG